MKTKHYKSNQIICGCDEAGRGALAGPVVASAVILSKNFYHEHLNDSKKYRFNYETNYLKSLNRKVYFGR